MPFDLSQFAQIVIPVVTAVATGLGTWLAGRRKSALLEARLQAEIDKTNADSVHKEMGLLIESNSSFRKEQEAYRKEIRSELTVYKKDLELANIKIQQLQDIIESQNVLILDLKAENERLKKRIFELEEKTPI